MMVIDVGSIGGILASVAVCVLLVAVAVQGFRMNTKTHNKSGNSGNSGTATSETKTSEKKE